MYSTSKSYSGSRSNSVEHTPSCPNGVFPTIRHNDIRILTAGLMSEVYHDVSTKPSLQPLSGESLSLRFTNRDISTRLDIKDSGFGGCWFQSTFFSMSTFLILLPLLMDPTPTTSVCVQSAVNTRRGFVRMGMVISAHLSFPLLEAWAPQLLLLINTLHPSCLASGSRVMS